MHNKAKKVKISAPSFFLSPYPVLINHLTLIFTLRKFLQAFKQELALFFKLYGLYELTKFIGILIL